MQILLLQDLHVLVLVLFPDQNHTQDLAWPCRVRGF